MATFYSPFCAPFASGSDGAASDFSRCFEGTTMAVAPAVLLVFFALITSTWTVAKQYLAGVRLEKGGHSAYAVKLAAAGLIVGTQIAAVVLRSPKDVPHAIAFKSVVLGADVLAFFLVLVSHPILPHSSTPLLFYLPANIAVLLLTLRTTLASTSTSSHRPAGHLLVVLVLKLILYFTFLAVEILGPDGFPSRIKLGQGEDNKPADNAEEGAEEAEDEWHQKPCPRVRANIYSRLTFGWMTPMMKEGYKKFLTEEDLWALPPDDTALALGTRLERAWMSRVEKANKTGKHASLTGALVSSFGGPFFVAAIFKLSQDCLAFLQPQLLRRLLIFVASYKSATPEPAIHGYAIALAMFVTAITQTLLLHCYFSRVFETGMRVRTGLIHLIYKKSLVLSNDERGGRLTGDIVNLQSTDATRLQDLCTYGQVAWSGLFQITLAFISLYQLLGWTMIVGVAVMVASMPLTAAIARYQTKLQRQQMKNKDQRTSIMSEILNNIRSIKLYAWEDSFAAKLFNVRNNRELVLLRKMGYLSSSSNFLWSFTPFAVAFSSFALFSTISGKPLTSEIVFPAITLFSLLGFPLAVLPVVFASLVEAYVSIERLSTFLTGKELQKNAVIIEKPNRELKLGDELVSVVGGEFAWSSAQGAQPALVDISLSLKKGELLAVVGRVGAGKSSLLSAILGEMTKLDGSVVVRGTVAYASQTPWIMGGTVRDNITFGHRYDSEFYNVVLEACALREDLAILPAGDLTEVGEKGISLSGGQKARVALARAVYARADVYLLDDPLSAVDAHVGRHLFDRVLGPNGLLAGKARLLSTNAISFCEQADELIFLRQGVILERGTYSSAITGDTELSRLLIEFGKNNDDQSDEEGSASDETVVAPSELAAKLEEEGLTAAQRQTAQMALMKRAEAVPIDVQKRETLKQLKRSTRPKEQRQQGAVKLGIYKNYIKANGYIGVTLYLTTIVAQQALQIGTNVWLKNWSQRNQESEDNGNLRYYLGIYAAFGVGASTMFLANGLLLYSFCVVRSATIMHDSMFHAVIRSPMRFFETTPLGTILNRFSRDVYVIDEVLARVFGGFFRTMAGVLGMVAVITYSAPAFLIVFFPLMFVYKTVQTYYLSTSRELKRLDATTKSPIFASFQETLGGVATIRAYRQSERFIAENEARVDRNQTDSTSHLKFLGSIIILSTAALAVFTLVRSRTVDAGIVGLMLSYALTTTQTLNWIVRSATEVETNIVSVERVQEYIDLEPEAPTEIPETEPAASWPETGDLTYKHVAARYREDLDLVLRDVNFNLKGGEKVGVCGRTGAGKSSLTMVLYRVVEPEAGEVVIDGVDVGKIGLKTLRSRLSIIPQDSQCFEGSLRENLDPTGKATDAELWLALEQCHLKNHVEGMEGKLDAHIDEGGSNLSAGQRQLMCLGRALLRHSRILVLDEATAAVDPESDKEIQMVIRREFSNCTIFVIAHRINTIMDCDKIICMDQGRVAEFASPAELLQDKNSIFYSLAYEAGLVKGAGGSGTTSRNGAGTPSGLRTPANKD
ncbi:putative ABC metal ion transporter [Pseudohyphozyma bogoriensis]|nr:putative ABC metal ion transporter [Pseudohyphozyma bogoriensis]